MNSLVGKIIVVVFLIIGLLGMISTLIFHTLQNELYAMRSMFVGGISGVIAIFIMMDSASK